ncbi:SAM-dependent methyltransferase [Streptosporangium canum]|uniref:SAM-dependent methyltransferase n=1 Tax=Streptosporangium canum TaxID=324952 RepID=UPI00378CEF03
MTPKTGHHRLALHRATPALYRLWDKLGGGKDNYFADELLAERLIRLLPDLGRAVSANRRFLCRAAADLAAQGMRQFVDLGAGLPSAHGAIHYSVQRVAPDARIVYVDHAATVVTHWRNLAAVEGVAATQGDVRSPAAVLADEQLQRLIDVGQPVAIIMGALTHLWPEDVARHVIDGYLKDLVAGSALVLSQASTEAVSDEVTAAVARLCERPIYSRSRDGIHALFGALEMRAPGVIAVRDWGRAPKPFTDLDPPLLLGGVGLVRSRT